MDGRWTMDDGRWIKVHPTLLVSKFSREASNAHNADTVKLKLIWQRNAVGSGGTQ